MVDKSFKVCYNYIINKRNKLDSKTANNTYVQYE